MPKSGDAVIHTKSTKVDKNIRTGRKEGKGFYDHEQHKILDW
jgi:3-hydroxyacyl-CoA dehydrogenase